LPRAGSGGDAAAARASLHRWQLAAEAAGGSASEAEALLALVEVDAARDAGTTSSEANSVTDAAGEGARATRGATTTRS
jgi:hypothetical protein